MILYLWHIEAETNGRYFLDIFNCILWNENIWISIKSSLKFVPKGPINNIQALVQIMAWCRSGDRRQAIILTNDGLVYWHIHVYIVSDV